MLVDVYGEGVLIFGDSGIGKSETAIELIKRGHRLVADDAVEITRIGSTLSGTAPELIRNYLEVRGVGVIDVEKLFGVGAVQDSTRSTLSSSLKSGRMTNSMTVWVSTKTTRPSLMCPCRRSPFRQCGP